MLVLSNMRLMANLSQCQQSVALAQQAHPRKVAQAKGTPTEDAHKQAVLERPRLKLRPARDTRCRQREARQQHRQGCCRARRRPPCSYLQQRLPARATEAMCVGPNAFVLAGTLALCRSFSLLKYKLAQGPHKGCPDMQ